MIKTYNTLCSDNFDDDFCLFPLNANIRPLIESGAEIEYETKNTVFSDLDGNLWRFDDFEEVFFTEGRTKFAATHLMVYDENDTHERLLYVLVYRI